jgi:predicted phosphatase
MFKYFENQLFHVEVVVFWFQGAPFQLQNSLKIEDTKGVIKSRKLMKDTQHNVKKRQYVFQGAYQS